jgi:hypothetical protein
VFANERRFKDSHRIGVINYMEEKDTRKHTEKVKVPGLPAHSCDTWEDDENTSSYLFSQAKCKSREITGASINSSSDVPSCCLSKTNRPTEEGRKKVIYTCLQNLIFLQR